MFAHSCVSESPVFIISSVLTSPLLTRVHCDKSPVLTKTALQWINPSARTCFLLSTHIFIHAHTHFAHTHAYIVVCTNRLTGEFLRQ